MVSRIGSWLCPAVGAVLANLYRPHVAQAAGEIRLVFAQVEGGSSVVSSKGSYAVEVAVILLLFGVALWVVCKSSRRA